MCGAGYDESVNNEVKYAIQWSKFGLAVLRQSRDVNYVPKILVNLIPAPENETTGNAIYVLIPTGGQCHNGRR